MFNKQAFTLIELIITIAIISLMAAAIFVSVNPAKRIGETKDAQRYSDLTAIAKAINLYTADNGALPDDMEIDNLKVGDKVVLCSQAQELSCAGQTHECMVMDDDSFLGKYLTLPVDPDNSNDQDTGYYISRNSSKSIVFGACDSYSLGSNLKIAATTKVDKFRAIYRSVGPSNTTALATGTSNALTISGNDATFASALADNIGVGDVIQYDSDNNGSVDSLAFIQGRYSSTLYSVVDVDGNVPTETSIADNDWDIFRAYTSLYDAERGVENIGIDNTLENFDIWSGGKDLVASDQQWNIVLYGDAADTQYTYIDDWNTLAENYIKIYVPYLSSEVGTSQRHNGVWDNSKYHLELPTAPYAGVALVIFDSHVKMEGLQIMVGGTEGYTRGVVVMSGAHYTEISHTILKSTNSSSNNNIGISMAQSLTKFKLYNTLIYGFNSYGIQGAYAPNANNYLIYNNTIIGAVECYGSGYQSLLLYNNIAQDCTNGFHDTFDADSDYNISDLASDAPGSNSKNSTNVIFVNEAGDDYHLAVGDTAAQDAGTDLSNDTYLNFNTDIDGETRIGAWDIGADEY